MPQYKYLSYIKIWWIPFIFWVLTLIFFIFSEFLNVKLLNSFSNYLLGFGLLVLLFSTIYQFSKKKWLGAVLSLFAFGGTILMLIAFAVGMFLAGILDGDHWADNLKIPENIPIHNPVNTDINGNKTDSIKSIKRKELDFQLYNSYQPGIYEFDLWTPKIEKGKVYLKAYEITQNYRLSEDRLLENTSVEINNQSDTIMKFGTNRGFTIYEGDWGKPYAARFEVWFKPENNEQERKLLEKNYKIEGWMH